MLPIGRCYDVLVETAAAYPKPGSARILLSPEVSHCDCPQISDGKSIGTNAHSAETPGARIALRNLSEMPFMSTSTVPEMQPRNLLKRLLEGRDSSTHGLRSRARTTGL